MPRIKQEVKRKDVDILDKFRVQSKPHKTYRPGREPIRKNETDIRVQDNKLEATP